jgi:glycerophosphoryl diester phosphodiesterase
MNIENDNHKSGTLIVAHRGASYAALENTIRSFELAFNENADFIEGDFRLTRDNHIVCIHDPNTRRITKDKSRLNIRSSNLSELKNLDSGFIPTLEEVLNIIPTGKGIVIEIKDNREAFVNKLVEILKQFSIPADKIRIIAFNPNTVRRVKKYLPGIKVYWLFTWFITKKQYLVSFAQRRLMKILKTLDCDGIDMNAAPYIDQKLVSYLRERNLDFCTYNVETPEDASIVMNLGVDMITTNSPLLMRDWIAT